MALTARASGSPRTITQPKAHDAGAWRAVQQVWAHDSGAWRQIFQAYGGASNDHASGSGNETVPTGASLLTITAHAPGGDGGAGFDDGLGDIFNGGGGGGGSKVIFQIAIAAADWGQNIAWVVGVHGATDTTVFKALTNGTINVTAGRGGNGADQVTPGAGGVATGGNVLNQDGTAGDTPDGGPGIDGYSAGGAGVDDLSTHNPGDVGHLNFTWS